MISELNDFWRNDLSDCDPLAHTLMDLFKDRWVRFHALPESKRYPENEEEYACVFSRHRQVLKELNQASNDFVLVLTEYSENIIPKALEKKLVKSFPNLLLWRTMKLSDEGGPYSHFYAGLVPCDCPELTYLFRLVADDEINNVMLVSLKKQFVFHPYDGGADVILPSQSAKEHLKDKFSGWLSNHPEGY